MLAKDFSHVPNFTEYMAVAFQHLDAGQRQKKILDIPAGNGLLAAKLTAAGHRVTCADINDERPDFVRADLNERLPFADGQFDAVVCAEGIEHTLRPTQLVAELCRVTRAGGRIVLTTPNVQSVFSRVQFLCCGTLFQFQPWSCRQLAPGEMKDRGHIAPMTYPQLRYHFQYNGARVVALSADRWKKKWIIPFVLPFLVIGRVWMRQDIGNEPDAPADTGEVLNHLFSKSLLFSRSLIMVCEKA